MNKILVNSSQLIIEDVKSDVVTHEYVVAKDSELTLIVIVRHACDLDICVRLAEERASARILGFIIGTGDVSIRLKTLQLHLAPMTTSDLLVKSILSDESQFFYDGGIEVAKNAQKVDAYQRNENIIVSGKVKVESKPKLEILANDVRCTHAATTAMISDDELWYLASRGIPKKQGERLILEGFFQKAIESVSDTMYIDSIRRAIWQNL